MKEASTGLSDEDAKIAKIYIQIAEKIVDKGKSFPEVEYHRVKKLLDGKISDGK